MKYEYASYAPKQADDQISTFDNTKNSHTYNY